MWDLDRWYTRVKLCEFESLDAAYEAALLGADALGFHLFRGQPIREKVRRYREILRFLPGGVEPVLLADLELPRSLMCSTPSPSAAFSSTPTGPRRRSWSCALMGEPPHSQGRQRPSRRERSSRYRRVSGALRRVVNGFLLERAGWEVRG